MSCEVIQLSMWRTYRRYVLIACNMIEIVTNKKVKNASLKVEIIIDGYWWDKLYQEDHNDYIFIVTTRCEHFAYISEYSPFSNLDTPLLMQMSNLINIYVL